MGIVRGLAFLGCSGSVNEGEMDAHVGGFPTTTNADFSPAMTFDAASKLYVSTIMPSNAPIRAYPPMPGTNFPALLTPSFTLQTGTTVFGLAVQD